MTDCFTTEKRSEIMSHVRSKDTTVELVVRKQLHRLGYRFRLHVADLPGKPDIVLPKHRAVILVHGCFWHGHTRCRRATLPESNSEFWARKIRSNVTRDKKNVQALRGLGWRVNILWQCQIRSIEALSRRLVTFLEKVPN